MGMKDAFILNLKTLRKSGGISQMKLAFLCGTDVSYIGQIEMGKRFPSIKLIEKIALALNVEPYRLFMNAKNYLDETDDLTRLPPEIRDALIRRLTTAINGCVKETLSPRGHAQSTVTSRV